MFFSFFVIKPFLQSWNTLSAVVLSARC